MSTYEPRITVGNIVRHAGHSGSAGREAAIMDVAQDLLLRHLHDLGLLDELAFKGGTSLRKLYAGHAGRFSVDLDFSVADIGTPRRATSTTSCGSVSTSAGLTERASMRHWSGAWPC